MKLALIPGLFLCVLVHASDWPQWRGPNRSGVSAEHLPSPLKGLTLSNLWSSEVGTGFSSIAISQGRLFTLGNQNDKDTVWCFDSKNGKELWRYTYEASLGPQYYEGGPAATPTVDNGRVFTISKWGNIFCFEARKGKILWKRDLRQEGLKTNRWGFAGSPLVWKNSVIFNVGDYGMALDCSSGQILWRTGTNSAGYASPVLFRDQGKDRVLIFAAKSLVAIDPEDGREVWRFPFETGWDTNNSDPLVYEDAILISSFTRGSVLLKVKADQPTVIYDLKNLYSHLSPGILQEQFLYAFSGEAKQQTDFRCIQFLTGE